MRMDFPITFASDHTPAGTEAGLYASTSGFHGGKRSNPVWIHSLLVLGPEDLKRQVEADWLNALNLTVVSESNQLPRISSIFGRRVPVQSHFRSIELKDGQVGECLPFTFCLRQVLPDGLYEDNFWVHVSGFQYHSVPARIERDQKDLDSFLEDVSPSNHKVEPVNQLVRAYDHALAGRNVEAVACAAKALKDQRLRGDLDCPNLSNFASISSAAALEGEPELAAIFLKQSSDWFREDVESKTGELLAIQEEIEREKDASKAAALMRSRGQLLTDLGMDNLQGSGPNEILGS